jgi:uroporphyrinogen-III synthase
MTVYTVGPATALAITRLHFSTILGADSGNGSVLANFILQTYTRTETIPGEGVRTRCVPPTLPLLFLVGDKRRDIIPRKLSERKIPLEELVVYESSVKEGFQGELQRVIGEGDIAWVALFSPMGAEIAQEVFQGKGVKIATIGPTTEEYITREWGVVPDVVAKKPEPGSLVQGIIDCK